jgi:hypothetical protein
MFRLTDYYAQARGCMTKIERRFIKAGQTEKFNKKFQDHVESGVLGKIVWMEKVA